MAEGDRIFLACEGTVFGAFKGLKVDGDSKWCSDFILAAVAAADGASLIIKYRKVLAKSCGDGAGFFDKFWLIFEEGTDTSFYRGHARMKVEDDAGFFCAFIVGNFFLIVGLAEEGECGAIDTCAGFDDVR